MKEQWKSRFFFIFLLVDGRIRICIHTSKLRILMRIQKGPKTYRFSGSGSGTLAESNCDCCWPMRALRCDEQDEPGEADPAWADRRPRAHQGPVQRCRHHQGHHGDAQVVTYLFTCAVVPHGSGRASQGTSAPGCSRSRPVSSRSSPLGAAQLVSSQLFVGFLENLTLSQFFHFCGNLIPVLNHSQAEQISAHVQSSMSHSNVQWVSPSPSWPYAVSCHLKPCLWIQATFALKDFVDHVHITLMSPHLQGRQT